MDLPLRMRPNGPSYLAALAGVVLGALATGCQPRVVNYQVRVVTSACVAPSPLENVTHMRFRVTGDGLEEPIVMVVPETDAVVEIPEIPAGTNRTIEVRAYDGDPSAGGKVVSMGSSLPFTVPDVVPEDQTPTEITIFLRRVGVFTPPSTADAPTTCSMMLEPRAGHTATLLADGRVFIAGGYHLSNGNIDGSLDTTEIFNPGTGTFEKAAGLLVPPQNTSSLARAFMGAVLLKNGQVLLAGGETFNPPAGLFPVRSILIYDPTTNTFGKFDMKLPRRRPGVAVDSGGRVLIVGGTDGQGKPVEYAEWYDPEKGPHLARTEDPADLAAENPRLLPVKTPRAGMAVAPVQGGRFIAVAGGTDGVKLADEVLFFNFDGTTFQASPSTVRLREVRYAPGIAPFKDSNNLLVAGGYNSSTEPMTSLNSSEIIATDAFNVSDGQVLSQARGDVCVAPLPDGRVVIIGGRLDGGPGGLSSAAGEMMIPNPSGGASTVALPLLDFPRYHHTCTTLKDGSVLVLGGVEQRATGAPRVLQDVYIYTPPPLD
ncbi:MAG: hypothetical protein IRZ16_23080 [Myxococcaceae bacterium]|nr:hypothetical protein [Myxococcaceae bacterium]